jgi:ABC-type sugar transport system permease subunit
VKYFLLLPAVAFFLLFTAWPLADLFRMSLLKTNFITSDPVGLLNYLASFQEPAFLRSLSNSTLYLLFVVPAETIGALILALAVSRLTKLWQDISRIVIYLPALVAGIIISQVWRWILHADGPINWALSLLGLHGIDWFGASIPAIPAISFIVAISSLGSNVIILFAAILSIDRSIFEAAKIDGATIRQTNRMIVVPVIWPSIVLVMQVACINALQIFETIYALAPYQHAATVTYSIYQQGFQFSKWGMASAQALILLVVIVAIVMIPKGTNT